MKKKLLINLLCLMATLSCAVSFSACDMSAMNSTSSIQSNSTSDEQPSDSDQDGGNSSTDTKTGQIPVYQGMTITGVATFANTVRQTKFIMKKPGNTDNNGNHNGWYKGDDDEEEEVDQENPYPDNKEDENIEEEIKTTLDVVGADQDLYYATKNEDVYIKIHLSNPDNYEILSFTLNGKKYSSYMFEEGSDMETLILKYNVGTNSGIQEYTIDAIKYIDGTEIKDVIMDGDKTVFAGIKTANQVMATVSNLAVQTNSFSFDINVNDKDALLAYSEGSLKAVLYNGETLVETKDLALGDNHVTFDGLTTNGLYQYAVVGYYDDLSGAGFGMNVLYKDALYTKSVVLFSNIIVGQEDIQFNFLWNENIQNKNLTTLTLYQGEEKTSLSTTATKVEDLLSNTEYTLIAEYINLGKTESIRLDFATAMKSTPVMEIVSPTKTQTSVGFTVNETDTDNVGALTKIELIHANGTVVADSLDVREFTGLLSNNTYTVKVTYTYDLNDGVGAQTIVKTLDITTQAKAKPSIEIITPTKTQTSVGFAINETDIDNIGAITKIELIHEADGIIVADDIETRSFENLTTLHYNNCTLRISYKYDLNDGLGLQEIVLENYFEAGSQGLAYRRIASGWAVNGLGSCEDEIVGIPSMHDGLPVLNINSCAFYNCSNLTSVIIGDGVTSIGEAAFYNCSNLTSVIIGDGVTGIGEAAFYNCSNLTSVIIGDGVTSIGEAAFYNCSNLTSLVIPESVTSIDFFAFENCSNLTSVVIPESVTSISDRAFESCGNLTIYCKVERMPSTWSGCWNGSMCPVYWYCATSPTTIGNYWRYENGEIVTLGEYVLENQGTRGLVYTLSNDGSFYSVTCYTGTATAVVIPSIYQGKPVKMIGNNAFYGNSRLTSIYIPNSVTSIGDYAFYECTKLTIIVPLSVTSIGDYAIAECIIKAQAGKTFCRKADGANYGKWISLGYSYYIGGVKLDEPHLDVYQDFEEIDKTYRKPNYLR